jgi:hypothetical protein
LTASSGRLTRIGVAQVWPQSTDRVSMISERRPAPAPVMTLYATYTVPAGMRWVFEAFFGHFFHRDHAP